MQAAFLCCAMAAACAQDVATELRLCSPLTTVLEAFRLDGSSDVTLEATITVPPDAPGDLGVGAFVRTRDGRWFQRIHPLKLGPGKHRVSFALGAQEALEPKAHTAAWSPAQARLSHACGLYFWSNQASRATVTITARLKPKHAVAASGPFRIADLSCAERARTGQRWELRLRPDPFPANPHALDEFRLDLSVTRPDGVVERIPGFASLPMRHEDRGDIETLTADGPDRFTVRYRPRVPGTHRLLLEACWGKRKHSCALPPLQVEGAAWDDYVRVDGADPRFVQAGGKFYWPVGLNLHSVNDTRCRDWLGTKMTPDRGNFAYDEFLDRYAAAGIDATEIWMSSWSFGLEWRDDWPGYHGQGRYSERNAWRLDQVLDTAWARGIRAILVIYNHGQGGVGWDQEWQHNPYNVANGGWLTDPDAFLWDERTLRGQDALRRYIVARYADHPAIIGWKLWTEIDALNGKRFLLEWHRQASDRWRELDVYGHPCTTGWSKTYKVVDRAIAGLPGIGFISTDAYHRGEQFAADIIGAGTSDPQQGLHLLKKPVIVTEYVGGGPPGISTYIDRELACSPWTALVSGNGGAPMTWWHEYVDQRNLWRTFRAVRNFITNEDLRGADARPVHLAAESHSTQLWCGAWVRPGRILGYAFDTAWARKGAAADPIEGARITIGDGKPGPMRVEWWDPEKGTVFSERTFEHAGGALSVDVPRFERHMAFKLWRER
jgi:hypothetical protein